MNNIKVRTKLVIVMVIALDRTGTMRRHFQHKPVRTWK